MTYKTGNVEVCDAVYIGDNNQAEIARIRKVLLARLKRVKINMYTYKDLKQFMDDEYKNSYVNEYI